MVPAEKASLMGSQFDSKQRHEQFVTHSSCFPKSRCNSLAFRISALLYLLLDLDTCGGLDRLGVFILFLKKVADIIAPKQSTIFHRLPESIVPCGFGGLEFSQRLPLCVS